MRVVGYARVSLDCSIADVLTRSAQVESIAAWARAHDHRLVRTYCDEGYAASSDLETRLALGDALQAVRDRRADAVVVARLDRLALSVVLQEQLLAVIESRGASLHSACPGEERETTAQTRDPTRLLVRDVVRSFPPFQSALRDLWVRQRWRHLLPEERAQETSALIRSEELVARGVDSREISGILSSEGFVFARVRPLDALRHLFGRQSGG
jgi:DNA invertase Pin-like site-specific DNA recombinase